MALSHHLCTNYLIWYYHNTIIVYSDILLITKDLDHSLYYVLISEVSFMVFFFRIFRIFCQ